MKKIISSFVIFLALFSTYLGANEKKHGDRFTTAFSAGFVFKHDCLFKEIYGHGVINVITADFCYYPWELCYLLWGFGGKVGYWRKRGQTTFLKQCTLIQEVPFTVYLRMRKNFRCGFELYLSLGGGVIWLREKNYLGNMNTHAGIGEAELGLNYAVCPHFTLMSAFRYLFPRQCRGGAKIDVGGFDIRAGIEIPF